GTGGRARRSSPHAVTPLSCRASRILPTEVRPSISAFENFTPYAFSSATTSWTCAKLSQRRWLSRLGAFLMFAGLSPSSSAISCSSVIRRTLSKLEVEERGRRCHLEHDV